MPRRWGVIAQAEGELVAPSVASDDEFVPAGSLAESFASSRGAGLGAAFTAALTLVTSL